MKAVTVEQFLTFNPCYSIQKIRTISGGKNEWTALDVLSLDIPAADKLWAVLREEFIDAPILHEFACRCAENALALVSNPDPRSVAAIAAKRKWLKGEICDKELAAAWAAAREAAWAAAREAAWAAAREAAREAAWAAAWAAAREAAREAAWAAAWATAREAAWATAGEAARATAREAAWATAGEAAREAQVNMLISILEETKC